MSPVDSQRARQFAVEVVRRLREAGFAALWAGGCVRDRLLGLEPKDYDVATGAVPEQIRAVFGRRKTLAIGQAFGVITVLGPPGAGQIEVATFRSDQGYSDGRHPDRVAFCGAEEDAQRRDFTINGMFFDPLEDRVVDYVGGQEDLLRKIVRAIGDPTARFAEDKLRMLRAVRFAAALQCAIDPGTLVAIQRHAAEITLVSVERISAELRRMLVDPNRAQAVELLVTSGLLPVVLPELVEPVAISATRTAFARQETVSILHCLKSPSFPVALAVLLRQTPHGLRHVEPLCRRLRLTTQERKETTFLLQHESSIRASRSLPWPQLQRILIQDTAANLLCYARAVAKVLDGHTADVDYAAEQFAQPNDQLNPPRLINGDDLRRLGIPPGPAHKTILDAVRDAQLDRQIRSSNEAFDLARRLASELPS